jgi:hypothetical protein
MTDPFVKIKPTDPFRWVKPAGWRKRNWSDSSFSSLVKADTSRWVCKKRKRMKSSYRRTEVSTVNDRGHWVWSIQINVSVVTNVNPERFL